MLHRTLRRLVYERFEGSISGDRGHMTLQQACTIFGVQMNEEWSTNDIKRRYKSLALKYHPDNGGSNEQFLILKEAHQIMLSHGHDKHLGKGGNQTKGMGVNFKRMNYDDLNNTIHRQTADREEYRSFGVQDFAVFLVFITCVMGYYMYRTWTTQFQVMKSRWSFSEADLEARTPASPGLLEVERTWHPWRADRESRDRMDDVALLQGSIRREVVEKKRQDAPVVYTPWQYGGPFARHLVSQYPEKGNGSQTAEERKLPE